VCKSRERAQEQLSRFFLKEKVLVEIQQYMLECFSVDSACDNQIAADLDLLSENCAQMSLPQIIEHISSITCHLGGLKESMSGESLLS
jgi:hypothetical protein